MVVRDTSMNNNAARDAAPHYNARRLRRGDRRLTRTGWPRAIVLVASRVFSPSMDRIA
jgi:hypothetical protein